MVTKTPVLFFLSFNLLTVQVLASSDKDLGMCSGDCDCACDPAEAEDALPCKSEQFKLKVNPICPKKGESMDRAWYRDARNPIIAVEARVPQVAPLDNPRSHYPAYLSQMGLPNFLSAQIVPTVLLHSVSLTPDYFGPKFEHEINLDYTALEKVTPNPALYHGWDQIWITVFACDDTNLNGKCSDEALSEQVSNMTIVHQMCHFPSAVAMDVWHCK